MIKSDLSWSASVRTLQKHSAFWAAVGRPAQLVAWQISRFCAHSSGRSGQCGPLNISRSVKVHISQRIPQVGMPLRVPVSCFVFQLEGPAVCVFVLFTEMVSLLPCVAEFFASSNVQETRSLGHKGGNFF
jgi:hypothetical protein